MQFSQIWNTEQLTFKIKKFLFLYLFVWFIAKSFISETSALLPEKL